MKCSVCKRKIPLVDEQLCCCKGCSENFCVNHRGEHTVKCTKFDTLKKQEEKSLLSKKILEEATHKKLVEII
jgi:hypothetical protein